MLGGIAFQLGMIYLLVRVSDVHIRLTAIITIFSILSAEFLIRYSLNRPVRPVSPPGSNEDVTEEKEARPKMDGRTTAMIIALSFNTLCLFIRYVLTALKCHVTKNSYFIRAVYRTIELQDGWNGRVIATEIYFSEFIPLRH
jgi:hypothetical protein